MGWEKEPHREDVLCGCGANVVRYVCNDFGALERPEVQDDGQLRFLQRRPERWEVSLKCFPGTPPGWLKLPGGGAIPPTSAAGQGDPLVEAGT